MKLLSRLQLGLFLFLSVVTLLSSGCQVKSKPSALKQVKNELCDKTVVILGEGGSHGEGTTEAFKAELIPALVKDCGFELIIFEAGFFEFAKISQTLANGETIQQNDIATALGGLWRFDHEVQSLIEFLTLEVNAKNISIGGMDDQLSAFGQNYANYDMFPELSSGLEAKYRNECNAQFSDRILVSFGRNAPYDNAAKDRLLSCLETLPLQQDKYDFAKVENLKRTIKRDLKPWKTKLESRAESMFSNLLFLRDASGKPNPKTIIWTATVHGMKNGRWTDGYKSIANFGERVDAYFTPNETYVLAMSALGGEILQGGKIVKLPTAPKDALETLVLESETQDSIFINNDTLKNFETRPASLTGSTFYKQNWGNLVDGVVIFKEQRPPVRIKASP